MPGRQSRRIIGLGLLLAALILCYMPARADVRGRPHDLSLDNPKGHCINCHDLHQPKLGEGHAHNLKRANEIEVCYQCHAGALNNYSSIDKSMPNVTSLTSRYDIRGEFGQPHIHFPRYGMDGEHNKCSYCHNPHGVFDHTSTVRKPKLLSAGPDVVTDTDEYCFVCHNGDANPPHAKFPNISVGSQYRFSRVTYKQMTHSTFFRWSTLNEPFPDTARTYDDNPYGAGKDISCLTCHRPHGSPNEHMLKLRDDQDLCLSCHNGSRANSLTPFTTVGHGKAGIRIICQSCHFPHGTGQENAVKTSITDPHTNNSNTVNVGGQGMNEACFACHGATVTVYNAYYAFNNSTAGWLPTASNYIRMGRDASSYYSGGGSMRVTNSSTSGGFGAGSGYLAVSSGVQYTLSAYIYLPTAVSGGTRFYINEYNASYGYRTSQSYSTGTGPTNGWERRSWTFTPGSGTYYIQVYLLVDSQGSAWWDELALSLSSVNSYQGKTAYLSGVHKQSPNTHNSKDTSNDQAAGDCDNCHNPHGSGYISDGSGGYRTGGRGYTKALLEQDQTLCYDCHNATTPNTADGRDIQAAFQMSSHHDLTKVKCVNCHNPHTATASQPAADPYSHSPATDTNGFCLSCHAGSMPAGVTGAPSLSAEWTNHGHDKTHALSCSDCHDSHGSVNTKTLNSSPKTSGGYTANFAPGMSFSSRVFCEACHNRTGAGYRGAKKIPTGAGYVSQHDQSDPTVCSTCHTKRHDPTVANYTGGTSYYNTACLNCHKQGAGNPYPNADAEFNTPLNATDANTRKSIHDLTYSPPASVDCVKCHGANHETDHSTSSLVVDPDATHGVSGPMPPISGSSVFCLECHDSSPRKLSNYSSPVNIMDTWTSAGHGMRSVTGVVCADCHTHHGSTNEKLIKTSIRGSAVMSIYSGNNVTVCTACHKSFDRGTPLWPGYSIYSGSIHAFGNPTTGNRVTDGRHGPGVCVNCHNPHGARVAGSTTANMTDKKEEDLCYTCHASGFDNFSTSGDYNNKWNRSASSILAIAKEVDAAQTSSNKNALHFGQAGGQSIAPGVVVNDGVECSNAYPDNNAVITVKLKTPSLTAAYTGTFQVGLRVEDMRVSGNFANIFYRMHTNPAAWISRYYGDSGAVGPNALGNEATTYHTLKIVRHKTFGTFSSYLDSTAIRGGSFNPTSGYLKVKLFCYIGGNSGSTTQKIESYFDDFKFQYTSSGGSAHNTASGDDVQARFGMKTHHKISDSDQADGSKVECTDCHDPHTITEKLMAFKEMSDINGRRTVAETADQKFCLKCHAANPPQGVRFPSGGVWNKFNYVSSAHGNRLFRATAFGVYTGGVACKVCHNPHGSEQASLQRESWDINRDGLPDDIDGDGVLDSSEMVGFIGYSTGTRKPLLVNTKSGIPSRSSFQRVSTTIPYQANGSIDVELCLNCHDGSPAPDVEKDFKKLSHHDVTYEEQVASGGSKIECYNCHDQHRAQARDDAKGHYPTTNPEAPREPMPGDAQFCLKCHDNTLPPGVSFGAKVLKNVKLSYNPYDLKDAKGYDLITSYLGHYRLSDGKALMCRECHNQHGSDYAKMLRDDTEPGKPGYDSAQHVQGMHPVALRPSDPFGGGDAAPLSAVTERCLACHSGETTYMGGLIPLPPPPDSAERGFPMSPVGKHPDLKADVTISDVSADGHIRKNSFAVITTPGSVKEACITCHDSHNPYISTVEGQLMDCYRCHNENTSLPDVQTEFNDNPTNPARSKSMHHVKYDPTGTTPYYVECLKCHDQTKHMQGRVRLRKDPSQFINYTSDDKVWTSQHTTGGRVDSTLAFANNTSVNQFCMECHDPSSTVAASFNRGGTEHVPPRLPSGHSSGAHFVNGTLACTSCHEYHGSTNKGMRKNARGDQETFCYSCHGDKQNSKDGVNVKARFDARSTVSHHLVSSSEQAAKGGKVECEDCHNPHTASRTNMGVDAGDKKTAVPADDAFCIGCHDASGAPGVKFPGYTTGASAAEWGSTGKWNRWDKSAYAGSLHQSGGISCKRCHDPHGSPNVSLLLKNVSTTGSISVQFGMHSTSRGKRKEELGVNGFCSSCHKNQMGVYGGYAGFTSLTFGHKRGVDKNCTYCHNPHGTSQAKLMRSNKPLYLNMTASNFGSVYNFKGFANQTTGAPYYTFCSSRSCHASERTQLDTFSMDLAVDNFTRDETKSSHHPLKEGVIGCTSCHNEHGSANAPDLRAPYYRESNWPQLFHSGRGVYSTRHGGGCGTAEPYDGSDYFEMDTGGSLAAHRNQVTTVVPPDGANDLCFMCHQKQDVTGIEGYRNMSGTNTKFLGHEAVRGGAKISHDISPNSNWVGGDNHNFSCSICHFPHSSSRGKLLKAGCFSQADGQYTNTGGTMMQCHAYKSMPYFTGGWRNLTTASKRDFSRPPNAVGNLAVGVDSNLTANLSWSAVADAPGQGAHHYNVYRSSQSITQATKPYATRIYKGVAGGSPGSAVAWSDNTCQPNTTYYYAVVACDTENNESFVSNCVTASVGADTVAPAALSDQQTGQVDGTYNIKVTWHDPGDNVNCTQYKVYRIAGTSPLSSGDITPGNLKATVTDTSLSADGSADGNLYSWTDTAPTLDNSFSYAVIACDAAGNASAMPTGSTFSATVVDPAPGAVTTLAVVPVSKAMTESLTWSAPVNVGSISGYNVYRTAGQTMSQSDLTPGNQIAALVTATTYADTAVPSTGAYYSYCVTAVDQSSGKESKLGNVVPVNIPSPPSGLTSAKLRGSVYQLGWSAPSYVAGLKNYNMYLRRNGGAWTAVPSADNMVVGGGFDTGLDGWNASGLVGGGALYSGRACAKLWGVYSGDKYIEAQTRVSVQPSTQYAYSGWVYVPAALTDGGTTLRVVEWTSSGGYVTEHQYSPQVTQTSGWQKVTDTWTTNASTGLVTLRVQLNGIGTAYWDDLSLNSSSVVLTGASVDLTGLEPGSYDFSVTASYNTYGGTTPYESVYSAVASSSVTDATAPDAPSVTAALTQSSNYTLASLSWTAPYDRNFTGYTPDGLGYYRIDASLDGGATWASKLSSKLANPSFESLSSGTVDDQYTDSFTGWNSSYTNCYAVSGGLLDYKAMKIVYTGSYDGYVWSAGPTVSSVANRTYSMSFWAKANKSTSFQYFIQANGGNYESIGTQSPSIGTSWQRFTCSGTFSAGATATTARVVIRPSSDTTAQIMLDGVRLEDGTSALQANDGSYYQPAGYATPVSSQSYDDPATITPGTSVRYRVKAYDQQDNLAAELYTQAVNAKPAAITDLTVAGSNITSANVLTFGSPASTSGLVRYDIYAKEQATPLIGTSGATLIANKTPSLSHSGNIAADATATANQTYSNTAPASYLNDGNTTQTRWEGNSGVGANYVTLTFPTAVPVYKVSFVAYGYGYQPKDYQVQTNDGSGWVTQVTITGNQNTTMSHTFAGPANATQVRLNITDTASGIAGYRPIIYEIMVYPGESYVHDLQNTALQAEVGHTYAYAVFAVDADGHSSDISGGSPTVLALVDKDGPDKVNDLVLSSPVGTTKAVLGWSTPQDNKGHGTNTGARYYEVYRMPTSSVGTPVPVTDDNYASASLVATRAYPSGTPGSFNNYTATWYDHKTVYYAVRSQDATGNWSKISNSPQVVVGKDVQAPAPPVITNCLPVASPEVDVYWTAAVDNIGVNGYRLFRADSNSEPFRTDGCINENNIDQAAIAVNLIPYNSTSQPDTGGSPGTTYFYALRAWDSENNMSNISNCGIATVRTSDADNTAPTWTGSPLSASAQEYPDVDLVWTRASDLNDAGGAGTIDHYDVYRGAASFTSTTDPGVSKVATVAGVRSSYVDNTGAPETTYYYGVVAVDASAGHNQSALSNVVSATVATRPSPDNVSPTVPANLAASTGVYPFIDLSWTASTDVDDASASQPLLYYKLYRADYPQDITDANKLNSSVVTTFVMAHDAVSYVARGIGGAKYNYRLEAFDLAGNASGLSAQVMGQVAPAPCTDTTAPSSPSGLAGVVGPSPDMDLSWTAATDSGSCSGQIDHYLLYRAGYQITDTTDLRTLSPRFIAGNSTMYTDSSGAPNTQYWYVMTAVDSSGNESSRSNIITKTTAADTMAPAAIADLKADPLGSKVHLTWCKPADNIGVDHYEIYRKEQATILQDADIIAVNRIAMFYNVGACLSYDDTGVSTGHTYSYAVIAVDAAGNRSTISRGRVTGDTIAVN